MGMNDGFSGDQSAWLRCYRCWSQRLEAQVHYDAILKVDPESGEAADRVEEIQEAVVQCLDCMHDQPHLTVEDGRVVPAEDRWERMVAGKPFVASCTVSLDQDQIETCSGPEAAESLTFGSLGDSGTREFFTHAASTSTTRIGSWFTCWSSSTRARSRRPSTCSRAQPGDARDHLPRGGVAPARARRRRGALAH